MHALGADHTTVAFVYASFNSVQFRGVEVAATEAKSGAPWSLIAPSARFVDSNPVTKMLRSLPLARSSRVGVVMRR